MILIFSGIFGLIVGSFLNAALWRMRSGESIVFGRSHCVKCEHELAWYELIPVLSFIVQRGRCRACNKGISWQYPALEIATALLFVGAFFAFPSSAPSLILYIWILAAAFLFIFVYDLRHYIIPDSALLIIIAATLVALIGDVWFIPEYAGLPRGAWGAAPFRLREICANRRDSALSDGP